MPRQAEGVSFAGDWDPIGMRPTVSRNMVLTDVFVPDEAVLGTPGGGFPLLGGALDMGRFSVAARCVGQAQRAIDLTGPYAMDREAFGQPIGEFQLVQQKLAEMVARLHLEQLGADLTELTSEQADYIGVPVEGPYKPDHYRY